MKILAIYVLGITITNILIVFIEGKGKKLSKAIVVVFLYLPIIILAVMTLLQ